jgi:hypothetical protein
MEPAAGRRARGPWPLQSSVLRTLWRGRRCCCRACCLSEMYSTRRHIRERQGWLIGISLNTRIGRSRFSPTPGAAGGHWPEVLYAPGEKKRGVKGGACSSTRGRPHHITRPKSGPCVISEGGLLSTPVEVVAGVYGPGLASLGGLPAVGVPQGRSLARTEDSPLPCGTSEAVMAIEKEQGAAMSGAMKRPGPGCADGAGDVRHQETEAWACFCSSACPVRRRQSPGRSAPTNWLSFARKSNPGN